MSSEEIIKEYNSFLEKSKNDKHCSAVQNILREYNKFISHNKNKKLFKWLIME